LGLATFSTQEGSQVHFLFLDKAYADRLCEMSRVVGWVLLVASVGGFVWAFKLLADTPGSLVGILLLVPVAFAAVGGVHLVGGEKEDA
jgi:drug/metabolite transporter (DMT)-like permease